MATSASRAINNVLANEGVGGCTYNPFGQQPVSAACLAYAGRTDITTDALTAKNVELSVQGPLFALPGGTAQIALGADYRASSFDYHPDSIFITGDTLSYGTSTPASGSQNAKEAFGELLLPLVKDWAFAQGPLARSWLPLFKIRHVLGQEHVEGRCELDVRQWHPVPRRLFVRLPRAKPCRPLCRRGRWAAEPERRRSLRHPECLSDGSKRGAGPGPVRGAGGTRRFGNLFVSAARTSRFRSRRAATSCSSRKPAEPGQSEPC